MIAGNMQGYIASKLPRMPHQRCCRHRQDHRTA